jgi:hypothetical protein
MPSPLKSISWKARAWARVNAAGSLSLRSLQSASPLPTSVRMSVLPAVASTMTKSVSPLPSMSVERKSFTLGAVGAGASAVAFVK